MKVKNKIIAACGNDCAACPRYTEPPYEKTQEQLAHTAYLLSVEKPSNPFLPNGFEGEVLSVYTEEGYPIYKKLGFEDKVQNYKDMRLKL